MRRRSSEKKGAGGAGKEMKVTSETVGPPREERFIDENNDTAEALNDAGEAAATDAAEAAERREARRQEASGMKAAELDMSSGFSRVITHLFQVANPLDEYSYLRGKLKSREERMSALSYGELVDLLDEAEDDAMRAAELASLAKVVHSDFDFNATVIESAIRKPAVTELEERKVKLKEDTKTAGKAITDADVEMEMARSNPDEWHVLRQKRERAKRTVDQLVELHARLVERAKDLRALVSRHSNAT
jgi:hypothetical protein